MKEIGQKRLILYNLFLFPPFLMALDNKSLLTLIRPAGNLNAYFSATECPIDLKPSCIFKFVCCLEVYEKRLLNLDRGGTLEGLLSVRVPHNKPRRVNFRVHLGVHEAEL